MIILSTLVFMILVANLIRNKMGWEDDSLQQLITMVVLVLASIIFAVFVLLIPMQRHENTKYIMEFNIIKNAVETSRLKSDRYENASLQLEVIDANKKVLFTQFIYGSITKEGAKKINPFTIPANAKI